MLQKYVISAIAALVFTLGIYAHNWRVDAINAAHEKAIKEIEKDYTNQCNDALKRQKGASDAYCKEQLSNCNRTGGILNRVQATCGNLNDSGAKSRDDGLRLRFLGLDRTETAELVRLLGAAQHNTTVAKNCPGVVIVKN